MKRTILDSAKYHVGSTLWYLCLEQHDSFQLGEDYNLFIYEHPIFTMTRTPLRHLWKTSRALPRAESESFDCIVMLLTSKMTVQSMIVEGIEFSDNTGEFSYSDEELQICLPEQILFSNRGQAVNEKNRIFRMIHDWSKKQLESTDEMFSVRKSVVNNEGKCSGYRKNRRKDC